MLSNLRHGFTGLCGGVIAMISLTSPCRSQTLEWTRQRGTNASIHSKGAFADSLGNVYLVGKTFGAFGGAGLGGMDSFVMKYDTSGNLQ